MAKRKQANDATLGQRVRGARLAAGKTLAGVKADTGLAISFLTDLEHDRRSASPENLILIARSVNVPEADLLELAIKAKTADLRDALARVKAGAA